MEFIDRNKYRNLSGIYSIRNVITGATYIGQTKQRFIKRFYHHVWKLKEGTHDNQYLQNSFNKHGESAFVFEIVKVIEDFSTIDEEEIKAIKNARENGVCYNIANGGDGAKGVPMKPEHLQYLSELNRKLNTGKKASEETRQKMSEARKGMKRNKEDIEKAVKTRSQKYLDGTKTKLNKITAEDAKIIKQELMNWADYNDLAAQFNVSFSNINAIRSNRSWKFVYVEGWDEYIKTRHRRKKADKLDKVAC